MSIQEHLTWAENDKLSDSAVSSYATKHFGALVEDTLTRLRSGESAKTTILEFWKVVKRFAGLSRRQMGTLEVRAQTADWATPDYTEQALSTTSSALDMARAWDTEPLPSLSMLISVMETGIRVPVKTFNGEIKDGMTRAVYGLLSYIPTLPSADQPFWTVEDDIASIMGRHPSPTQIIAYVWDRNYFEGRTHAEMAPLLHLGLSSAKHVCTVLGDSVIDEEARKEVLALYRSNKVSATGPYTAYLLHKTVKGLVDPLAEHGVKLAVSEYYDPMAKLLDTYVDSLTLTENANYDGALAIINGLKSGQGKANNLADMLAKAAGKDKTKAEEVEPTKAEEVEPTKAEKVEPTQAEEVEPTKAEEVEPTQAERPIDIITAMGNVDVIAAVKELMGVLTVPERTETIRAFTGALNKTQCNRIANAGRE